MKSALQLSERNKRRLRSKMYLIKCRVWSRRRSHILCSTSSKSASALSCVSHFPKRRSSRSHKSKAAVAVTVSQSVRVTQGQNRRHHYYHYRKSFRGQKTIITASSPPPPPLLTVLFRFSSCSGLQTKKSSQRLTFPDCSFSIVYCMHVPSV